MHAQTLEAGDWWARSRGAGTANWIATYQNSVQSRQRTAIAAIIKELGAETVLEVGCHCGPNLVRVANEMPGLQAVGVDINADAIEAGRNWIAAQGLASRIQLQVGRVPHITQQLPDGGVDVVLSCYALAYIAPSDLDAVLYDMGRLASKAIIIAEPMVRGTDPVTQRRSLSGYNEWAHDYDRRAKWIGTWRGRTLRVATITPPVDKLHEILVAVRDADSTPSAAATA